MTLECSKIFYRFEGENQRCANEATQYVSTEQFFLGESYCSEHGAEIVDWLMKRGVKAYVCYLPKIHVATQENAEGGPGTAGGEAPPQPPQGEESDANAAN